MKALGRWFVCTLFTPILLLIYRVRRIGTENVPVHGGVLLLSNHVSYIDSFILVLCTPRPVRFVVVDRFVNMPSVGWFLRLFDVIPIRRESPRDAIAKTVEALRNGDVVCMFPEGELTRTGVTMGLKKGFELVVRKASCPVVPVYMDGLWRSIFSYERERYFNKWPRGWRCPLQVAYGEPIPPEMATVDSVREHLQELSVTAFHARRDLERSLEVAVIKALKRNRRHSFLIEQGKGQPRDWSRGYFLGLVAATARKWMMTPPEDGERIGILLPPGPTPAAINLGLFLAGKTPVNLPFTINQQEMEDLARSIAPLGIRTVITSKAFMPHLMDFWQGDEGLFIDLKSVLSAPGPAMTLLERIRAYWEPAWMTRWRLSLNARDPDREAVGLVERPGEDAILLSARDLHANTLQVISTHFVQPGETILSELSMSRAAGLILGFWVPLLHGGRVVSRSFSQRESFPALSSLILHQGVTLLSGTADFYRNLREPLAIKSLRFGLVFDEINPFELADCEETVELPLARAWDYQGRIVTLSRTDPNNGIPSEHGQQIGRKAKSVGRVLPGIGATVDQGDLGLRFSPGDAARCPVPGEFHFDEDNFLFRDA